MTFFEFGTIFFLTFLTICVIMLAGLVVHLFITVKAMERSTHRLEYVPIDPNWGSTEKEINEINEASELEYPDLDDDDKSPIDIDLNKMI